MIRSRIAPTPSGYLHLGNAYGFLLTEAIVRNAGGSLRLRIDDLDTLRKRPEYVADIFESLQWLGIASDDGPSNADEQEKQHSQQNRIALYSKMLGQLRETGLVFACSCSRKELQQHSEDGQYAGACLHKGIPLDEADVAWRIRTPRESAVVSFRDRVMGNQSLALWHAQRHFIIRRRDGLPAYHVASLCDDVAYDINTVVRGQDLLASTGAQLYLAGLLGMQSFRDVAFYHHPLLVDSQGQKLSKSSGSTSLKALREAGTSAGQVRKDAASWYRPLLGIAFNPIT